ncbi:uncharacterized protein DDB_G0283697-like [Stomoxys calcitrans]|uniref:uncharacterized protein DDB_G0283697-like n=1 Tax=Stomoxys calcitrans TaxID=35570 RepID=UPI0027E282B1|nr:uncharacterized protein DDB_G0283697-like [Stomoxys calcitrans]
MMFANDDDMVECPYNNSHRMLRKRLQSHLLKCRIQYPDVELRKCPFNLSHLIPEPEFTHHVTNCSDRKLITQYKYDAPDEVIEEEHPKHEPIQSEENWDDTDVPDYDPTKYVEKADVIRQPLGPTPSLRKAFIKEERKRLGDADSDEEEHARGEDCINDGQSLRNNAVVSNGSNLRRSPGCRPTNTTYNCDDDPYYISEPIQPKQRSRSRSPQRSYRDGSPVRANKNRFTKSYRDRSPSGSHRYRSPSRSHRDHSPSRSYRDRSPRSYRDRSPRSYRDGSPTRQRRNDSKRYRDSSPTSSGNQNHGRYNRNY